jgi:hypothetical protein
MEYKKAQAKERNKVREEKHNKEQVKIQLNWRKNVFRGLVNFEKI